jgi:hypothetical protein
MENDREVKGRVPAEAWDLAAAEEKERAAAKDAKGAATIRNVAEGPVRDRDSVGEKK